jgi:hypothetical protein
MSDHHPKLTNERAIQGESLRDDVKQGRTFPEGRRMKTNVNRTRRKTGSLLPFASGKSKLSY